MIFNVPCLDGEIRKFDFCKPGPFHKTLPPIGELFIYDRHVWYRKSDRRVLVVTSPDPKWWPVGSEHSFSYDPFGDNYRTLR